MLITDYSDYLTNSRDLPLNTQRFRCSILRLSPLHFSQN